MNLRYGIVAALALASGCASNSSALERQYDALQKDRQQMRTEAGQLSAQADQLFREASALESQRGLALPTSARCSTPSGSHRPGANPVLGPLRFKQKAKSVALTEGAPFDAGATRCSPMNGTPR